jgi:hypothetical protein
MSFSQPFSPGGESARFSPIHDRESSWARLFVLAGRSPLRVATGGDANEGSSARRRRRPARPNARRDDA